MSRRTLEFDIPLNPVAQGRPIFSKFGGARDPEKSKKYKDQIKQMLRFNKPDKPLEGALLVDLTFYREIPSTFSKKKRAAALAGRLLPTQRPDVDNYAKAILDSISGNLYQDDSQVTELRCRKRYSENLHTHVIIRELESSKTEQIALEI